MPHSRSFAALVAALLLAQSDALSASAANFSGWRLEEVHKALGNITLSSCDQGLKWENKGTGIIVLAAAPDYKLRGYNLTSRKCYEFTRAEVVRMFFGRDDNYHRSFPPAALRTSLNGIVRGKESKIAGHKVVQYIYPARQSRASKESYPKGSLYKDPKGDASIYGSLEGPRREIWFAEDIRFPRQVALEFTDGHQSDLPMPIRLVNYRDRDGRLAHATDFDTLKLRQTTMKASEFTAPKGFGKVGSQIELFMSEEADALMPEPEGKTEPSTRAGAK